MPDKEKKAEKGAKVRVKNLEPQTREYILDALPGEKRPETIHKGVKRSGGIEYPLVRFGGRRTREAVQEIDAQQLKASAIKTALRRGYLRLLSK